MSLELDIGTLSGLTGVKPHNLRMWEKRYSIFEPQRTPGGTRIYTDKDLKKLLTIQELINLGYKISEAINLSENERKKVILQTLDNALSNDTYAIFINEMLKCAVDLDETHFELYFRKSVERFGKVYTITNIIYPLLNKLGALWKIDNISPLEEHFASQIITRMIQEWISLLPIRNIHSKKFVLFLPPNHYHQIPLLFANYLLRKKGFKTYYLGEDVPLENLKRFREMFNEDVVYLTFLLYRNEKESVKIAGKLFEILGNDASVWISGEKNNLTSIKKTFNDNKNLAIVKDLNEFYLKIKKI